MDTVVNGVVVAVINSNLTRKLVVFLLEQTFNFILFNSGFIRISRWRL